MLLADSNVWLALALTKHPSHAETHAWLARQPAKSLLYFLLAEERISRASEPRGLAAQWKKFSATSKPSPKLWMDAFLAAFAVAGGYQLVTMDKAFRQFKGLDLFVLPKSATA